MRAPLVIVLHGGFGTASQAENSYGWDEVAEKMHFLVAYPNGTRFSWNAGGDCCGRAITENVDDVNFISQTIIDISKNESVDLQRVYITGISNGAAMAYRYACEGHYHIAAIGAVAGSLSFECPYPHGISVMEIHGLEDQNIPMAGGVGPKGISKVDWLPVEQVIHKFRVASSCKPSTVTKDATIQTDKAVCSQGREVTLITIADAGHQWPGGKTQPMLARLILPLDPPSDAMNATWTLWQFFANHKAP